MAIYLISDLHLDADRGDLLALFEQFLNTHAQGCEALYVLGDLFESWVGDDDQSALAEHVAQCFAALRAAGTALYFQAGNRDFLLGSGYAARAGFQMLPELYPTQFYQQPVLLAHGDQLCLQDHAYQQFRAQVRDPAWQRAFLGNPLAARQAFAAQARAQSRLHQSAQPSALSDVDPLAVQALHAQYPEHLLIHGHTHRPAIHQSAGGTRVVLGDWGPEFSFLRVVADEARLHFAGQAARLVC